jgi:hypothetical protein
MIDVDKVRTSIQAEKERLEKRPVPKDPWIMPLSMDDMEKLLNAYEALNTINILRSNLITTQSAGWSNLVYPLVAILEDAGFGLFTPTEEQIKEHRAAYGGAGGYPGKSGG